MKFLKLLTIPILLFFTNAQAQYATVWSKSSGSASAEGMNKSVIDQDGNIYVLSSFESDYEVDKNTTLQSNGGKDVLLTKYNASGEIIWSKSFGSENDDMGNDIAIDNNGDLLLTGGFSDNIDFGNNNELTSNGGLDAFILKMNTDGEASWSLSAGGSDDDMASTIESDANGNIYITGTVSSLDAFIDLEAFGTIGGNDIFVARIESNGEVDWVNTLGATQNEEVSDLAVNSSGEVLINASIESSVIIGDDTLNSDLGLGVNLIYDVEGELIWSDQNSGMNNQFDGAVEFDSENNFYTTGTFEGTKDFGNTTLTSQGGSDIFIIKQDAEGEIEWVKQMGGQGNDGATDITIVNETEVVIGGYFEQTMEAGDSTLESAGEADNFITSFNAEGSIMSSISAGGSGSEMLNSLTTNANGEIIASGTFESSATFKRADETSNGESDHYVWKIESNNVSMRDVKTEEVTFYPNPATNMIYIQNQNIETAAIYNLNGQKVKTFNSIQSSTGLFVGDLEHGVYLLKAIDNEQSLSISKVSIK
jgi:hypothetical protein